MSEQLEVSNERGEAVRDLVRVINDVEMKRRFNLAEAISLAGKVNEELNEIPEVKDAIVETVKNLLRTFNDSSVVLIGRVLGFGKSAKLDFSEDQKAEVREIVEKNGITGIEALERWLS